MIPGVVSSARGADLPVAACRSGEVRAARRARRGRASGMVRASGRMQHVVRLALAWLAMSLLAIGPASVAAPFRVEEATIDDLHQAMKAGRLTARQPVEIYLRRTGAYDKQRPAINA